MSAPKLQSSNLVLRNIKSKDLFAYSELFSDRKTMALFGGPPVNHVLDLKNVVNDKQREYEENQAIFWSITEIEEREFIGFIRIMNYESFYFDASYEVMGPYKDSRDFSTYIERKGWELDYALLAQHRGKGIMTEAVRMVVDYCTSGNFMPLYAKVNSNSNTPTIKVLKKNGFQDHLPLKSSDGELGMIYQFARSLFV